MAPLQLQASPTVCMEGTREQLATRVLNERKKEIQKMLAKGLYGSGLQCGHLFFGLNRDGLKAVA